MSIIRAVAYPRYSSDNQREESIDAQIRAIEEYCQQKGYVLINSYPDEAKSATTDNRPNFQKMMVDSEKGLFDVVIVHKLDRFARDRYDSAYYKRLLKKNGVRLESVLERLDSSPESIILESVLEGMAEYYSKNLAREARKGQLENAHRGLHAGGRAPYGYKVDPDTKKFVIDEEAAKAVVIYFEGIAAGMKVRDIADKLNNLGYRTQSGQKFTRNSFDGWAYNLKYKGVYTWDVQVARSENGKRNTHKRKPIEEQTIIEGAIPAIISAELWDEVNKLMQLRRQKPGRLKATAYYLLSGKIICGNCGTYYIGSTYKRRDKQYSYYKCNKNCGNRQVRKEYIEELAIEHIIKTCFTPAAVQKIVQRVKELYAQQFKRSEQDLQPIKSEIADLNRKINNWLDAIGDGLDKQGRATMTAKINESNNRKAILEAEYHKLLLLNKVPELDDQLIIDILEKQKRLLFSGTEEERKQALQDVVESITILPTDGSDDDTEIEMNVRFFAGVTSGAPLKNLTEKLTFSLYRRQA